MIREMNAEEIGTIPAEGLPVAVGGAMTAEQYAEAYLSGGMRTARLLISRGSAPEFAEEIAQAAWVRDWEHRANLREPLKVINWVNTIALNLYRSSFRRREVSDQMRTSRSLREPGRQRSTSKGFLRMQSF